LPNPTLISAIKALQLNQSLEANGITLAYRSTSASATEKMEVVAFEADYQIINRVHDIFSVNHSAIETDFNLLTANRTSAEISKSNTILGQHPIFIEEGAQVEAAVLNAKEGCIYIGKDAEIMEGALIRGPFALCEHATVKMGAKIYTGTTIGPHCKVGGEVSNSVMFAYSNKGHDGFLGNSVIGEWCNLGADSNNSNLKNNYEMVKLWNYSSQRFEKTGLQFCGLIMGDHSKCGINTMFNTGTVVGVSANIFGSGFPRQFVPSFSWGGSQGFETYSLDKACQTADLVMQRRHLNLSAADKQILNYIFNQDKTHRNWES
jgi:UDP-N-acetylglucosamine diphosphorylase/glucosamine-1-phosphate N-acetyltransferase